MHRSKSALYGKLTTGVCKRMKALKERRIGFDPDFKVLQSPVKISALPSEIPAGKQVREPRFEGDGLVEVAILRGRFLLRSAIEAVYFVVRAVTAYRPAPSPSAVVYISTRSTAHPKPSDAGS